MRADFLDKLGNYPTLVNATNKHRPLLAKMEPDELRQAIEQPAAHHGVVFEVGLVEEIIKDVQGQAGYLPLLQYTLNLLWETEEKSGDLNDRMLNINTYRELGSVRGALQKHVDQIYLALIEEERLAVQRIFLKLVEIGGDEESGTEWKPVRRRALRSEFDNELEQRVLIQLIDENLLVSDHQPQTQESTVEIAHEALLSSWEKLSNWIAEHRRAIALRNRLNDDVAQWQTDKKEDELWSGAKLLRMQELRKDSTFNQVLGGFSLAANQFIDASLQRRDRQRRRTVTGLASFSIIALVLAGVAVWQGQRSERLRLIAEADQSGVLALRGFESGRGEIESLLSAIEAGQKLKALVNSHASLESYPTTSPVLALQTILDNIQERNQFNGHRGQIYGVSFSPNGQHFVTTGEDGAVRIWEFNGKNTLLERHEGEVWDVKFAPNGQLFATVGEDAIVRLWNLSGHIVQEWQVDRVGCHSLIFTPDGQSLITACNKFTIWNLSGRKIDEWNNQDSNAVLSMSISQNGQYLLASGFSSTVQLWDLSSKNLRKIELQQRWVPSVSFTPDNQQFVTASASGDIRFWDLSGSPVETPNQQAKVLNNLSTISSMRFSPDGQRIVTTSLEGTVRFWSVAGRQLAQFNNQGSVSDASFSPDGQHLVIVEESGGIKLLDLSKQLVNTLDVGGNRDGVNLASSFDLKYLATTPLNAYVQIWDIQRNLLADWQVDFNGWFVSSLSFSQDNRLLATASDRWGTVRLWNTESVIENENGQPPNLVGTWCTGQQKYISAMDFSSSGLLAVASNDGQAKIWNPQLVIQADNCYEVPVVPSNGMMASLDGHEGGVLSIEFSPDGKFVATGGLDGKVLMWNVNGQQIGEVKHQEAVSIVRFSPDEKLLATGWADGTIRILNTQGQEVAQSEGHQGAISSLSFSSDGQTLVSGGVDGIIRVWNLLGQQLTRFDTHQGEIQQISFTPDGKIVTAGSDGTVRVWQLGEQNNLEQLLSQGCSWLKDYFTTHPEVLDEFSTCQNSLD
jgi:WD40 repeat protein